MYGAPTGDKLVTTNGELTAAGDTIRVFNVHILSSGTKTFVTSLLNGGVGGDIYIKETGTVGTGKTIDYGINGKLFTNGCYVSTPTIDDVYGNILVTFRKDLA